MSWHPKTNQRLVKLERLDRASGEKYCWAKMVCLGMMKYEGGIEIEEAKESCRIGVHCKKDSISEGSCWCNKFVNGELQATDSAEPTRAEA